ncbi:hypothetical protein [Dyadobacter sp. CY356]|uniref:hypothetical protein n=1 Tax=Dyadobacter sp. CY356 TaxID=2906442 RepID=UPI001F3416C3|nr:hypothetical protein [Dyadobacter sp. CY356]MCF0059592.1 hypothetical protein [Dyadobacter sp. CY356]
MKSNLSSSKILITTFCFLILLISFAKAQNIRKNDVIVTRTNEKIEAIIQEVDSGKVKYKKASDPEGPVFTIEKKEISSIFYGNGEVEKLDNATEEYFAPGKVEPPVIYNKPAERIYGNNSQSSLLNADQLRENYNLYIRKSRSYKKLGIISLSAGILFTVIGFIKVSDEVNYYNTYGYYQSESNLTAGSLLFTAGLGAGIPLTIIGFVKAKRYARKAVDAQQELRRRNEPFSLRLSPGFNPATQSGYLSLRLKF